MSMNSTMRLDSKMPTRQKLEEELGKAWAAMARREGHRCAVPTNNKLSGDHIEARKRADTLMRAMQRRPQSSIRSLAAHMNTTPADVGRRMMHLQREGRVKLVNRIYEVIK